MTTRKILLLFVPVAGLLMFALLRVAGDDESMSGSERPRPIGSTSSALLAPGHGAAAAQQSGDVEQIAVADDDPGLDLAGAAADPVTGRVSGRLVDANGLPIAGEPLLLVFDADPWHPERDRRDDSEPPVVLAGTVSGEDGAFELPAQPGVHHDLLAGGGSWPRLEVSSVHSGDALLVRMEQGHVLEGWVLEADFGAPVAGAWVFAVADVNRVLGRSGADGSFRLGPLPGEGVVLAAWAPGFDAGAQAEIAPALGPATLELPPAREVHGRLVSREDESPVTEGEVRLVLDVVAQLNGGESVPGLHIAHEETVSVDATGGFVFRSALSRGFTLEVTAPGFAPLEHDRYALRELGEDEEIVIMLMPLGPLAGRVEIAEGSKPAPGATVTGVGANGPFVSGLTDDSGAFSLDTSGWDGAGPVYVEATDGETLFARVKPGRNEWSGLLLELVPALALDVQVVRSGEPLTGAEVAARSDGSLATIARSGRDGLVSLLHPLAGPEVDVAAVQARFAGRESLPVEIDPAGLPEGPIVVDLDAGGGAWITVTDRSGAPIESALATLRPKHTEQDDVFAHLVLLGYVDGGASAGEAVPGSHFASKQVAVYTDADGRALLEPLLHEAEYRLAVRAAGYRNFAADGVYSGDSSAERPLAVSLDEVVTWEGRVVEASSGRPMDRFTGRLQVERERDGKFSWRNASSKLQRDPAGNGEFAMTLPGTGRYRMQISATNYLAAYSEPVDFDGVRQPPWAELVLWPAAVLEVTVLDGRGRPVPGYGIAAVPWEIGESAELPDGTVRKQSTQARTNEAGFARLFLGEGGAWRVAGGPGLWLDDLRLSVMPGPPVARTYTLPATGDLEIAVLDEHGQPLAGARVDVRSAKSEKVHQVSRRTSMRGRDGVVVIESIPPGDYQVRLRRRGYTTRSESVLVHANGLARLTVTMDRHEPNPVQVTGAFGSGQFTGQGIKRD
jgi:hypothetical protein